MSDPLELELQVVVNHELNSGSLRDPFADKNPERGNLKGGKTFWLVWFVVSGHSQMLHHEICDEAQHGCMEEATHLRSQWPRAERTVDFPLSPSSTCLPCDLTSLH